MKLGFSGSRNGMNKFQHHWFERLVKRFEPEWLLHGACQGADETAVVIMRDLWPKQYVKAFPPVVKTYLSKYSLDLSHVIEPPKDYLVRNDLIVAACDFLIATPSPESKGTRYTISRARTARKPVIVIEIDSLRAWS